MPKPVSPTKQSAPIPEFKTSEFGSSQHQAVDTGKTFTGVGQKAPIPNFETARSETSAAQPIAPMTEPKIPGPQSSGATVAKTPSEIQAENPPVIPSAMLSATTDAFPKADRSFFEIDYADEDAQAPVVTMSEAHRQTQAGRQESAVYSPKKRSGYWLALGFCLLLFAALVLAVWFWLGVPQSRQIATVQPADTAAARTLEFRLPSFGLGKSIDGLEFYDVVAAYRVENGASRLVVEGEIRNTSNEVKTLSPLRAVLFDDAGQPLADWTFDGGKPVLEAGQKLRFHTALNSPPTAAVNYEVAFTDSPVK